MSKLSKKEPEKRLVVHIAKTGGRNSEGRISAWQRGGGAKKMYRMVDFAQGHKGIPGIVTALEYDPNRNAHIALVEYGKEDLSYVLAPHELVAGDSIVCDDKAEIQIGNRMRLANIPVGTMVYNVELVPEQGGKMIRSAGAGARIAANEGGMVHLVLPSSEVRKVSEKCFASIGTVSNPEFKYKRVKNAGRSRLLGRRPNVRGTVMNPVDHPHGGGEGTQPIGLKYPKTPWGKHALGVKTRKNKKWTNKFIVSRRKKKKKSK